MNIMVINCGSSSLKYTFYNMNNEEELATGSVERIGTDGAILNHQAVNRFPIKKVRQILEHKEAIRMVISYLTHQEYGVISSIDEIHAVGHRVVHGAEAFSDSVVIDDEVKETIRNSFEIAPLHNPANMRGILAFEDVLGSQVPMVAVFDTAFHQTMPEESYLYAIPMVLYKKHKIRRYGFHGTSHKYVSHRLSEILGEPIHDKKIISCHLGNGASITAIMNGASYDTSMGMTPLEGLIMGTRSGDLDAAIVPYAMAKEELSIREVDSMLNKHSGLVGISGLSSDVRDIIEGMNEGHPGATLAFKMYIQRIRKYIGAYAAEMNGVDTIIFTAGVGENSSLVRQHICEGLTFLGLELDQTKNELSTPRERKISTDHSQVDVYVIPTNEELMIARDTLRLVK